MTQNSSDIEITDNPDARRFEARLGGKVAGFVQYRAMPDEIVFIHTEVDPAFEGRGVGSVLAAGVLDAARQRGLGVVPRCPFIARYIQRHPDYADLVVSGKH